MIMILVYKYFNMMLKVVLELQVIKLILMQFNLEFQKHPDGLLIKKIKVLFTFLKQIISIQ